MSDKRSVSTDALETLGTIIGEGAGRDAIHLAVEPAVAGEYLAPGTRIGLAYGLAVACSPRNAVKALGIVDPFLAMTVQPGERFWLVVLPRQITSLRHVWSHPDFPESGVVPAPADEKPTDQSGRAESEAWLRAFVERSDCPSYEEVLGRAVAHGREEWGDDEYLCFVGTDAHGEIPPEFWDHVERVTGVKVKHRASWFSCSC